MRIALIWIGAAFVFGTFYTMVAQKERLRLGGTTVYLALVPSNLQGEYMTLDYAITSTLDQAQPDATQLREPDAGALVIRIDNQNIGHFVRYHHGEALGPGEHLLKYHHEHWNTAIGTETYFIPEGAGPVYEHAAYGELKLEPDGTPLLLGLRDKELKSLTLTNSREDR